MMLLAGQTAQKEAFTRTCPTAHGVHAEAALEVATRPLGQGSHVWVSPLRKVPAEQGAAAAVIDDTVGGATTMLDGVTDCSTGSLDCDSCVPTLAANPVGEIKLAFTAVTRAETLVRTENEAVALGAEVTRRRPAAGGVPADPITEVMTTVPLVDDRLSDEAMMPVSVAFCVCPKLDGWMPAKVRLVETVYCVTLANPGAAEMQAVAPAVGE